MKISSLSLLLLFFAIQLSLHAQNETINVPLHRVIGKFPLLGAISPPSLIVNKADFILPVDSSKCTVGYIPVSLWQDFYTHRNDNDSLKNNYNMVVERANPDTMQFVDHYIITNKIVFCVWMDGKIKNIAIDTDSDSSFTDEEIIKTDLSLGLFEQGSGNAHEVHRVFNMVYDSAGITMSSSIPIRVATNCKSEFIKFGNNDSLLVYIEPNFYYTGEYFDGQDSIGLVAYPANFDQFYLPKPGTIQYSCKYFDNKYWYTVYSGEPLRIHDKMYSIDSFDWRTKSLNLKFDGVDSLGVSVGNFFPRAPGLVNFKSYSLVFFTASWCGPCKLVIDSLKMIHDLFPGIEIYNINSEKDSTSLNKYIQEHQIDWTVLMDGKDEVYGKTYQIQSIPTLIYIGLDRKVLFYANGYKICLFLLNELKEKGVWCFDAEDE